jgi:putative membrane protein
MRSIAFAALAVTLAAPAGTAAAADRAGINFMRDAYMAGTAEVELSRLALQRSPDREVRRFAQRMVDQHSRANRDLIELARREGVRLPTGMDRTHRQAYDRLRRMSGNAFDRVYLDVMMRDHDQAVALFRAQERHGRDRDVRAFAARYLPTIQEHRTMARDVRRDENQEARGR